MEYRESDLGCVAFLLATGHKPTTLQDVDRRGRIAFIFENLNDSAAKAAEAYFTGALVKASDYAEAIREVKGQMRRHCEVRRA